VVVLLHVIHNSGLRSSVFAGLVRHLDVAGVDNAGMRWKFISCSRLMESFLQLRKCSKQERVVSTVLDEANSLLSPLPPLEAWLGNISVDYTNIA
jgi:hypothetical protein